MTRTSTELEQAVSRTLRDSLQKLQRTTEELDHAVNDLVSACASSRPSNALSPITRAQSAAASLSASLEVLSRFVIGFLQSQIDQPAGAAAPVISEPAMDSQPREAGADLAASNMIEDAPYAGAARVESQQMDAPAPVISESVMESQPQETVAELAASNMAEEGAPSHVDAPPVEPATSGPPEADDFSSSSDGPPPVAQDFDVAALAPEQRELHRRADRVAKVAMQDIKMLRPDQVSLGKKRKDLCARLGDDIERARKEYDRRFQTILGHPVDYFYNRMVEILGDGDPETLGEYPYPSPVLRR